MQTEKLLKTTKFYFVLHRSSANGPGCKPKMVNAENVRPDAFDVWAAI